MTLDPIHFDKYKNAVQVNIIGLNNDDILRNLESICIAIAEVNLDTNPCGLFRHPLTNIETTLRFTLDAMLKQNAIAMLVENMYIACNNPAHIIVETNATESIEEILSNIVTSHLLPSSEGGYVAKDRPKATWIWRCDRIETTSDEVIASYKEAGGEIEFL